MVQTILGSGGAIGIPMARELTKYSEQIRLVSRNPKKVNDTDEIFPLDVHDLTGIDRAIAGSEVVYVTIGFEYNIRIWETIWPPFMKAVINACKKHNARLVFFDNVYMYDKTAIPFMTEDSFINPPSRKGAVRQLLHEMIMKEKNEGHLKALIARSADFYGPDNRNSPLVIMAALRLMKGKKAQAFGDIGRIHTYTCTPDAARAIALLGNTPDAFGQVWHVPTTREKLTTMDWIELIAKELDVDPKVQKVPAWMIRALGLFVPVMREFPEMLYQYEQDYIFDSSKFENLFGITATAPSAGIRKTIESLRR
ncbi:MAG: NAD-dependent epimerase/dehydratase family protein [Bacteroidales bacterium]|nr:NAD-dependent epimerase/dehydratase family protein [Bacteroidales bacterium]